MTDLNVDLTAQIDEAFSTPVSLPVASALDPNLLANRNQRPNDLQSVQDRGTPNYLIDGFLGIADGVESFGESVVNLGIGGANLFRSEEDDFDYADFGFIDAPETLVGGLAKGITQFTLGFVLPGGHLGKLAQAGKLGSLLKTSKVAQGLARGAVADFVSFEEHEARLSNLIEQMPGLSNPITEFLSAEEDDGFVEGRLKNVIEGLPLGVAAEYLFVGLKNMRNLAGAKTADQLAKAAKENTARTEALVASRTLSADDAADVFAKGADEATDAVAPQAIPTPPPEALVDQSAARGVLDSLHQEMKSLEPMADRLSRIAAKTDPDKGLPLNLTKIEGDPLGLDQVTKVIGESLKKEIKAGRITHAQVLEEVQGLAKRIGGDWETLIEMSGKDIAALNGQGTRALVYMAHVAGESRNVQSIARKALTATGDDLASLDAQTLKSIQNLVPILFNAKKVRQQLGQALNVQQLIGPELLIKNGKADEFLAALSSSIKAGGDKRMSALRTLATMGDNPQAMVETLGKQLGSKTLAAHNELWINGLLSSFKTHAVNAISNTTNLGLRPVELMLGGILSGNSQAVKTGWRTLTTLQSHAADSLAMSRKAFQTGEAILDPHHGTIEAVTGKGTRSTGPEAFGVTGEANPVLHPIWSAISEHGINLPSRALIASDELFKQLNYRSRAMAEWTIRAEQQGLARGTKAFDDFVSESLDKTIRLNTIVTNNPRVLDRLSGVDEFLEVSRMAKTYAEEGTWTKELDPNRFLGQVQGVLNKNPLGRLVIPFYRTPVNLIRDAIQHTPGMQYISRTFREGLQSPDPIIQAQFRGKQATGTMIATVASGLAANGMVTGGGPSDVGQRRLLMETGWRPYSIAVPNGSGGKDYISYSRIEPIASVLGLFADFAETGAHLDGQKRQNVADSILLTMSNNFTSKTFLVGLADFMEAASSQDAHTIDRYLKTRINSYVPRALSQLKNDEYLRETQGYLESLKSQLPGYSSTLPPKRNLFGEPITAPHGFIPWASGTSTANMLSPLGLSRSANDPVKEEIAHLGRSFGLPSPTIGNGTIDLRELQTTEGRQAYDRYQELVGEVSIGGRTVAEAMDHLIKSDRYQSLPNITDGSIDNPRAQRIQRVLQRYREAAKRSLLRENNHILQQVRQQQLLQIQAKRGGGGLVEQDSQLFSN